MPTYTARVHIDAPPEVVYARVADLATHGDWSTDPLRIEPTGEARFRSTTRAKGKDVTSDLTIVDAVPPARFVFDAEDLTGRWRHTFTLSPSANGTTLTRTTAGTLSGAQLLLYWVVLLPIKKPNAARALRRLKALIEDARA